MSDSTGDPRRRPDPPDHTSPHGQPGGATPYGQPSYGQPSHGQPPSGQPSPYGPSPYGQPSYPGPGYGAPGYGPGFGGDHDQRPGTVTTGAVLALVFSGLGLAMFGFALLATLVASDLMAEQLGTTPGLEGIDVDQVVAIATVSMAVMALWCLGALVLAIFALRRSNGARIGLVVSAVLSALFCLLSVVTAGDPVTAVPVLLVLAASVTTAVCLLSGSARAWYAHRPGAGAGGTGGWQGSPVA